MNVDQPVTRESCGIVTGAKLGHSRAPHGSKNKRTQLILHSLTPFLLARPGSFWPLTFCATSVLPNCSALQTNPVHTQRQATFETRHRLILGVPEVGYLLLW